MMAYWMARDKEAIRAEPWYEIHRRKPLKYNLGDNEVRYRTGSVLYSFCPLIFERILPKSAHLKPGECRKIKSIKIEFAGGGN